MSKIDSLKLWAKKIKKDLRIIYIAYKKPEVPWYSKLSALIVIGYALSPVDLIPDFIPVLGYLDDLILIPLGIYFVMKLIPNSIIEECRQEADNVFRDGKPKNWFAGSLVILFWVIIIILLVKKMR